MRISQDGPNEEMEWIYPVVQLTDKGILDESKRRFAEWNRLLYIHPRKVFCDCVQKGNVRAFFILNTSCLPGFFQTIQHGIHPWVEVEILSDGIFWVFCYIGKFPDQFTVGGHHD